MGELEKNNGADLPPLRNPPKMENTDDLTSLSYLNEPAGKWTPSSNNPPYSVRLVYWSIIDNQCWILSRPDINSERYTRTLESFWLLLIHSIGLLCMNPISFSSIQVDDEENLNPICSLSRKMHTDAWSEKRLIRQLLSPVKGTIHDHLPLYRPFIRH